MHEIVYYYVPNEYILLDKKQKKIIDIDLKNWAQINVGDDLKSVSSDEFVNSVEGVSNLLWKIKESSEDIFIKYRIKKNILMKKINDRGELCNWYEYIFSNSRNYVFLYYEQHQLNKMVFITGGEIVEIYFRHSEAIRIENILKYEAQKTEYIKYELDLD